VRRCLVNAGMGAWVVPGVTPGVRGVNPTVWHGYARPPVSRLVFRFQPFQNAALIVGRCASDLDQQFVQRRSVEGEVGRAFIADRTECAKVVRFV